MLRTKTFLVVAAITGGLLAAPPSAAAPARIPEPPPPIRRLATRIQPLPTPPIPRLPNFVLVPDRERQLTRQRTHGRPVHHVEVVEYGAAVSS
jgi:hypothetical protein